MTRVVLVGAGLAGLRTAEGLRRRGHTGPITLIGAEAHAPYHRPPLSKSVLLQDADPAAPAPLLPAERLAALDVDLRLGAAAAALDPVARRLTLADGEELTWDRLVVATGVRARELPGWTGLDAVGTLRTFDDALRLRGRLAGARSVLVVGAGVLGSEVAAAARGRGLEVELVDPLEQPVLRVAGPEVGAAVARLHAARGVRLHLGVHLVELERHGDRVRAALSDGEVVETDTVLVAVGSAPNVEWLSGSGVELHPQGVVCDPTGWTGTGDVFAVGDVAAVRAAPGDEPRRLEHWTHAGEAAGTVAGNLLLPAAERVPVAATPYVWSDLYDVKLQTLGSPGPDDRLVVVDGGLDELRFLALFTRGGVVTGAVAANRAALLMRTRRAVAAGWTLDRALAETPWTARATAPSAP